MEANELMIGDKLRRVFNQKIVEVKEIKQSCIYTENNGYEYDEIEPIPLTQEILEKNEFIGMPYAILKIDDNSWLEYYYHEHRLIKWWSGIDEWESHSKVKDITFQCHCIYIHELQHALRLCGIEKEIIL